MTLPFRRYILFLDILKEALLDTLKTVPFLFLAYLLMEWLEHRAEEKSVETVDKAGGWAPVAGGVLGMIPQCGFSAAAAIAVPRMGLLFRLGILGMGDDE